MRIRDAKIGDFLKVPVTDNQYFSTDVTFIERGQYKLVTLLAIDGNGDCVVGWIPGESGDNIVPQVHLSSLRPGLVAQEVQDKHPLLTVGWHMYGGVPCEVLLPAPPVEVANPFSFDNEEMNFVSKKITEDLKSFIKDDVPKDTHEVVEPAIAYYEKKVSNPLGLLFLCIGAGAGLSHYATLHGKRQQNKQLITHS